MIAIWNSIKQELQIMAPAILNSLNKSVSLTDIDILESVINAKLPDDFKVFYTINNGQKLGSPGLIECEELLSIQRIIEEWKVWNSLLVSKDFEQDNIPYTSTPDAEIKNDWWNPLWIPFTHDGSGNYYCLDLDPTDKGTYGQIIRMWHDDPERSLEATSFTEWIVNFKDKLVSKQLVYSDSYNGIIDKDKIDY